MSKEDSKKKKLEGSFIRVWWRKVEKSGEKVVMRDWEKWNGGSLRYPIQWIPAGIFLKHEFLKVGASQQQLFQGGFKCPGMFISVTRMHF